MKDTVIKGTHNSRSILGATTIPLSWEESRAQLISSGWPIDLGPLNNNGVSVHGTDLNKASLLTDTLCTALGLATTATPNQAMDKLRTLIATARSEAATAQSAAEAAQSTADGRAQIAVGSYTGSSNGGSSNPNSLTFSFVPKVLMIPIFDSTKNLTWSENYRWVCIASNLTTSYVSGGGLGVVSSGVPPYGKKSSNGKTIYWYSPAADTNSFLQFNSKNTFYYIAIG